MSAEGEAGSVRPVSEGTAVPGAGLAAGAALDAGGVSVACGVSGVSGVSGVQIGPEVSVARGAAVVSGVGGGAGAGGGVGAGAGGGAGGGVAAGAALGTGVMPAASGARRASESALVLEAQQASYRVGGREVLSGLDLELSEGELVALVGPNGAGKSSALRLLSGLARPARGHVRLAGREVSAWRPLELARHRALMVQQDTPAFSFTVEEAVALGRHPWRGTPESAHDTDVIAKAITTAGLAEMRARSVRQLSGGERQRVSFARLLAQDSPIMLLDEPTAALDLHYQEHLMGLLRGAVDSGKTVVVVLHDLSLAAWYADRMVLLANGQVRAKGSPSEVCEASMLSDAYGHPLEVTRLETGQLLVSPVR